MSLDRDTMFKRDAGPIYGSPDSVLATQIYHSICELTGDLLGERISYFMDIKVPHYDDVAIDGELVEGGGVDVHVVVRQTCIRIERGSEVQAIAETHGWTPGPIGTWDVPLRTRPKLVPPVIRFTRRFEGSLLSGGILGGGVDAIATEIGLPCTPFHIVWLAKGVTPAEAVAIVAPLLEPLIGGDLLPSGPLGHGQVSFSRSTVWLGGLHDDLSEAVQETVSREVRRRVDREVLGWHMADSDKLVFVRE